VPKRILINCNHGQEVVGGATVLSV